MEGVARSMEPVRGRRVSPLRANLSAFFGGRSAPPIVQGEPYHVVYGSPAVPVGRLTTAIEGTVVPVVEYVHEFAQAEQRLEQRVINQLLGSGLQETYQQRLDRELLARYGTPSSLLRRGPYQGG